MSMIDSIMEGEKTPNSFTENLGALIRQARQELGWNQNQLAQAANLRQATISDIENGKVDPSISTLARIAIAVNRSIGSFIPVERLRSGVTEANISDEERALITSWREISEMRVGPIPDLVLEFLKTASEAQSYYIEKITSYPNEPDFDDMQHKQAERMELLNAQIEASQKGYQANQSSDTD